MSKVPKLRFKEFSEEWEEKQLSDVSTVNMGQSPDSSSYNEDGIGMPLIQGNADCKYRQTAPRVYTSSPTKICQIDDIIMTVRAPVGAISKSLHNACIGRGVCAITAKEDNAFLYQLLINQEDKWEKLSQGSTFTAVNSSDIKNLKVLIPNESEQQKIASFLSEVDTKIDQLTRKKELLEQYKKGVMQKIFSQELRFKADDGSEFPEWEEKRLGDVADLTSSKRVYLSDYVKEGIPFYRGKEISELKQNQIPSDVLYITCEAYENFKNTFGVPQINDILITAVGTLGNVYRIKDDSEFYFKDGNLIWLKNIKISSAFLEVLLEVNYEEIQKSSIGSTQRALTIVELKKLKITIPSSFIEQTKIANFLSAIGSKIDFVAQQLEEAKNFKKGLLQQMFV